MISLFMALIKGIPIMRNIPPIREDRIGSTTGNNAQRVSPPAWYKWICKMDLSENVVRPKKYPHLDLWNISFILESALRGERQCKWRCKDWELVYTYANWVPIKAWEALPFELTHFRTPLVRTEKPGLLAAIDNGEGGRIKSFTVREAIRYSYLRDSRFLICLCAKIGFGIWWYIAPEQLLLRPHALCSPDLSTLLRVARDTFFHQICSIHPHVPSPCECGEPLNNAVRILLNEPHRFDPLGIQEDATAGGQAFNMEEEAVPRRLALKKAFAVYMACILLSLALTESVSPSGVALNLTP